MAVQVPLSTVICYMHFVELHYTLSVSEWVRLLKYLVWYNQLGIYKYRGL